MLETLNSRPLAVLRTRLRLLLGLAVLPVLALVVSGCGNSVPDDAVANVDGEVIEQKEFDHWLVAAARSQQAAPGAPPTPIAVPDPPKFDKCAAQRAKGPQQPGAPKLDERAARAQCKQEYDLLKEQVMQFLVSSRWIEAEADDRGIEAEDAEVNKSFQDQKRQSFPDDKQYQDFLKASGQTEEDLKYRVKLDVLSNDVREEIVKDDSKITDQDVRDFYNKNKAQFGQPERRDLSVVLTEKEGDAEKAKQALEDGDNFKEVSEKYSIDEASKDQGGKLTGLGKGQQEKALDDAVFTAQQGKLTGPVRTQFGFYVFEVDKVTPGSQQSFEQSRETIKQQLRSEKEQKALNDFVKDFQEEFKRKTNCKKGFVIAQCENGPKLPDPNDPAAGGAQGAPPQQGAAPQGGGAPPQGVPQQGAPPSSP